MTETSPGSLTCIIIFMIFNWSVSGGGNELSGNTKSDRKSCIGAKSENSGTDCCNGEFYNPGTCCNGKEETEGLSAKAFKCCGFKPYSSINEICCESTVQPKPATMAECCGKVAFNPTEQLCCGLNKTILTKASPNHQCCHQNQYNIKTECCCSGGKKTVKSKSSNCCGEKTTTKETNASTNIMAAPKEVRSHHCGSSLYDPEKQRCCRRKHGDINSPSPSGQHVSPTLYNPKIWICCDGSLTKLKPWMDQCCGNMPYGLAQRGVLCCKNILYTDRKDGEECSKSGVPYNPFTETMCASKLHKSPGGHCCGEDLYQPNITICCKGQRYNRTKHIHCCGAHAYNIFDPLKKCCEGTLYNMTREEKEDMQCCGSVLMNVTNQDVCCTSEDQSLFYQAVEGFECCGHHYYNPALWSCCAGTLSPVHHTTTHTSPTIPIAKESKLQLVNNLKKTQLCNEIFIGVVESVSRSSTVFSNVLKIKGNEATVEPNVFILETPDQCKFIRLTTGKPYFFNYTDVFTDFNHESVLQSLHFILSKCS